MLSIREIAVAEKERNMGQTDHQKKIDMTDPDGNTNYGRIYYSPIDEEHIVEYEQDSGCGYIDNEVLVVANDGVSREQIAELAVKYFILE